MSAGEEVRAVDVIRASATDEATARYGGPRMFAETTVEREMFAFVEGALWAVGRIEREGKR